MIAAQPAHPYSTLSRCSRVLNCCPGNVNGLARKIKSAGELTHYGWDRFHDIIHACSIVRRSQWTSLCASVSALSASARSIAPRDLIERKCSRARQALLDLGLTLVDTPPVSDDPDRLDERRAVADLSRALISTRSSSA